MGALWVCLSAWLVAGVASPLCAADIVRDFTGLSGYESVYGADLSAVASPYENTDNYSVTAAGDATGTLTDVSYRAFGLYAKETMDFGNAGTIELSGTGGTAVGNGNHAVSSPEIFGMAVNGTVANSGTITVTSTGGSAQVQGASASAYAYGGAAGIYAVGGVSNTAAITAIASGGTASSEAARADAAARAYGIYTESDIVNSGDVQASATGGSGTSASGEGSWDYAEAWGLEANGGAADNSGALTVTAQGGTSAGAGNDQAYGAAWGIKAADAVNNSGAVTVSAVGGTARGAGSEAHGKAFAIKTGGSVANSGALSVTAQGGTVTDGAGEEVSADGLAFGVETDGDVVNSGVMNIAATGGSAAGSQISAEGKASAIVAGSDVQNTAELSVAATGGSAAADGNDEVDGDAGADTSGIESDGSVANSGALAITATGGDAVSDVAEDGASDIYPWMKTWARAAVEAVGIMADGPVDNDAAMTVTAAGGSAAATATVSGVYNVYSDADAAASGIESDGAVANSGDIAVTAAAGLASSAVWTQGAADADAEESDAAGFACSYAMATAIGVEAGGTVTNDGSVTMTATGGDARSMARAGNSVAAGLTTADSAAQAVAQAESLGILADGDVANNAAVTVTATGGTSWASALAAISLADTESGIGWSDAEAYAGARGSAMGIRANGSVDNHAAVTVAATGGTALATAATVASGDDDGLSEAVAYASADSRAYGIRANGSLANDGALTVSATGGHAEAGPLLAEDSSGSCWAWASASSQAAGMLSGGDLINNGALTVAAQGGSATSSGSYADASAEARGVTASGDVNNQGLVKVDARGGSGSSAQGSTSEVYAETTGIEADGNVTNSAIVTLNARGGSSDGTGAAQAYAQVTGITAGGEVTNSGSLFIGAVGGSASGDGSEAGAMATGLLSGGDVTNSGHIMVIALAGSASGTDGTADAAALGIVAQNGGTVVNSGSLYVDTRAQEGSESFACGIYFTDGGYLTNTGTSLISGDRAYEVYVEAGTVTLVDHYTFTLYGDADSRSLYVNEDATLALNNATLEVAAKSFGSLQWDTEYHLFDGDGTIDGAFGEVTSSFLNPAMTLLYHDQGTADSGDDSVSIAYRPQGSPTVESAGLLRHMVTLSGDLVGQRLVTGYLHGLLADAGPRHYAAAATVASDAAPQHAAATTGGFFFTPYYANVDKDAAPAGYDADLVGFVTGAERCHGSTLYGFHLGYGHAGIDFTGSGYRDNQEDQELLSGGLHAMGRAGNWTWRGQVGGFYGWHDYDGLTGAGLTMHEQADYHSYGAQASLLGGYLLQSGSHVLLPEAGVEYLWLHRNSFTTDADYASWDMHSDSLDEHQVSVRASLRWLTRQQVGEVEVTPSLAAGVRYLVTDDNMDVHQSVGGSAPFSVGADLDELTGTVSASLRLRKRNLATELAYGGQFGDDSTAHSAWLRFSYLY
jgi:hypothetical protein